MLTASSAFSNNPPFPGITGPDASGTFLWAVPASSSPPGEDAEHPAATGTWRVGLEARRTTRIAGRPCAADADCGGAAGSCTAGHCGLDVTEAAQNPVFDFKIGGGAPEPRRTVVAGSNCANCHGTFSVDLNIHGGSRNNVEYCVVCHNPNVSDFDRRRRALADGAVGTTQTIHLKALLHRIHSGELLTQKPYIVYGFGQAPANYTPHDFGDVRFPRDRRDCAACHVGGSQLVPLPSDVLPTRTSVASGSGVNDETPTGSLPATASACLSCHDAETFAVHAALNTTVDGVETCSVCHGDGKIADVAEVHRLP
jgi:OmcA/MtrC family decaheme c-type cytochrome